MCKERSRRLLVSSRAASAVPYCGGGRASFFTATVTAVASLIAAGCSPRTHAPDPAAPAFDQVTIKSALGISPATWSLEGGAPGAARQPVDNVTKPDAFSFDVSGAIHRILVDPTNTATVYAGSASGGVFKADGATGVGVDSASVLAGNRTHWVATTDGMPSLSVSAMAMDPMNPKHIVVGTGHVSNFSAHGVEGIIYYTTDGGANWTPSPDMLMRGRPISGLAVRDTFVVATVASPQGGVFVSNDGGKDWEDRTNTLPGAIGPAWDVVADPANVNQYFVLVAGQPNIFGTTNSGLYLGKNLASGPTTSWTRVSDNDAAPPFNEQLITALGASGSNGGRMAVGPTGRVFVASWALGHPVYLGYTADEGQHWTRLETPRFPPRPTDDGVVTIKEVHRQIDGSGIVVEATADHGFNLDGNDHVRIQNVSGFSEANGDWLVGKFFEQNATDPSRTKFFLLDRFTGLNGTGNSAPMTGTGGTLQRWYDTSGTGQTSNFSFAADPSNPDIIYLAGDHDSSYAELVTQPPGRGQAANIARCNAADTMFGQIPTHAWTFITGTGTPSTTTPHGDTRGIAFNAKNEMLLSSDGGIFLHPNPRGFADWVNLNGDMSGLEVHDLAFDPLAKIITASTQDNGVPEQPAPGSKGPWQVLPAVLGDPKQDAYNGDGGDVQSAIETSDPTKSVRIASSAGFGKPSMREFQMAPFGIEVVVQISGPTALPFMVASPNGGPPQSIFALDSFGFSPFALNVKNSRRLVVGSSSRVWESPDLGQSATAVPGSVGNISSFAYGHPSNEDALWATVYGKGVYFRLSAGAPLQQHSGFPEGDAWAVVMTPANPASAYVTTQQHVYFIADATAAGGSAPWTDVTGDLSSAGGINQPPGKLRAIVYISSPTTGDRIVVAASDAVGDGSGQAGTPGVFMMAVNAPGIWTRVGSNLPNASAYDLVYDSPNDRLYVGLAGRGVWSVSNVRQLDRPPVARCRPVVTVNADGTCHATVAASAVDNGSSDPDGGSVTLSLSSTGPFGLGSFPVTLKATDSQNASSTCSSTVTVVDSTPPIFTSVPPNVVVQEGMTPNLGTPTVSDACPGTVTVTNNAPATFPIGVTTVTWTATDAAGNSSTATQTVTVTCTGGAGSCSDGHSCQTGGDCGSKVCTAGACTPPSCKPACNQGNPCGANSDCGSQVCVGSVCQPPACSPHCLQGTICGDNGNCSSFVCTNNRCAPSSCSPNCNQGAPCGANGDCLSRVCQNGQCQKPACSPTCASGARCNNNGDCRSFVCNAGICR